MVGWVATDTGGTVTVTEVGIVSTIMRIFIEIIDLLQMHFTRNQNTDLNQCSEDITIIQIVTINTLNDCSSCAIKQYSK